MEVINEWELVEVYCRLKINASFILEILVLLQQMIQSNSKFGDWYADFTEDQVLDAMKTMGTWDMVTFDNVDAAIANACSMVST